MGLLIVSQRPAKVDKNVLSQCSTQVIMRVTNPNDLKAITKSLEGISSELEEEIKRLPPGVALLVNPDIPMPVMVQVRVRRTRHGGLSAEVSEDESPLIEEPLIEEPQIEKPAVEQKQVAVVAEEPPKKGITESLFHRMFGRR
jgi:DNA helicase HerA-like ATPase